MKNSAIFNRQTIGNGIESQWLPTVVMDERNRKISPVSIQIVWEDIESPTNCKVELIASNDANNIAIKKVKIISTENNKNDAWLVLFRPNFSFFKIKCLSDTNQLGKLSAFIYYQ